jgi:hypothetical protein
LKDFKREYVEDWCDRPYVAEGAAGLVSWLPEVLKVSRQIDNRELAEKLLDAWIVLGQAALDGKLKADDARLTLRNAVKPVVRRDLAAIREQRAALVAAD